MLPAGRKRIEDLVDRHLAEVRLSKTGAETGASFYSLLLQPIPGEESSPRLSIVPDGRLHFLPFGSLTDVRGRYLLESHVVTYAPSATVLYLIRNSPMTKAAPWRSLASAMFNTYEIRAHRTKTAPALTQP